MRVQIMFTPGRSHIILRGSGIGYSAEVNCSSRAGLVDYGGIMAFLGSRGTPDRHFAQKQEKESPRFCVFSVKMSILVATASQGSIVISISCIKRLLGQFIK